MNNCAIYFRAFELVLFTLPIMPQSFYNRVILAGFYFVGHVFKIKVYYARFKYYILNNGVNREDDPTNYNEYFHFAKSLIRVDSEKIIPVLSELSIKDISNNIDNTYTYTPICDNTISNNENIVNKDNIWDDVSSDSYSDISDMVIM